MVLLEIRAVIHSAQGDILNSDTEALVNTVNCVGVMGRGVALQFKKAFPANFKAYEAACEAGLVQPGHMFITETGYLSNPKFIVNFPTKRHWKAKSLLADIDAGLAALRVEIVGRGIRSIALPPLGCGMGGLDWSVVRPRIVAALSSLPGLEVFIYEPVGAPPPARMAVSATAPGMTAGRAVLIELMARYLRAVLDPSISLLEIHKLLYFMQEAGEPLRLRYAKALYGPYAANLRHVLTDLEGHYLSGYGDAEDSPTKAIELLPGATALASRYLSNAPDTLQRFDRVASLIHGFETPFGLELLATVHWVVKKENASGLDQTITQTYAWNDRKRAFSKDQIAIAYDALISGQWLS